MEPLQNRRLKSKSEQLSDDLANDLENVTKEMNEERKAKGKKPLSIEIDRGYEGRG
jgi:uncharacterized protein YkwD